MKPAVHQRSINAGYVSEHSDEVYNNIVQQYQTVVAFSLKQTHNLAAETYSVQVTCMCFCMLLTT